MVVDRYDCNHPYDDRGDSRYVELGRVELASRGSTGQPDHRNMVLGRV
jgi:hypothetical protein